MPTLRTPTVRRSRLSVWLLPTRQRRTQEEIVEALDVRGSRAKRSAYWTMLSLSAAIATAGVIADSTATVIGAMIIAPLATPIMGVALSLILRDRSLNRRSLRLVTLGALLVIAVGLLGSIGLPGSFDLLGDSQISSRTSPTLVDLGAAIATGFAGAVGLARKDVSDVLPGVAVAISLVPPLAVVGVCLGQGALGAALGAFVLFLSNVIAMILAGTVIFAIAYGRDVAATRGSNRRAYATLGAIGALVVVVLAVNSAVTILTGIVTDRARTAAQTWVADTPGAEVRDVTIVGSSLVIEVLTPEAPPSAAELRGLLDGEIPSTFDIVVEAVRGERLDLGPLDAPTEQASTLR